MKTLYWLTHDLRLDDNLALAAAAKSDSLLLVYCVNPRWFSPYRYHLYSMGNHRWNFLQESLTALNQRLLEVGHRLCIIYEQPELALTEIIKDQKIDRLICSRQFGFDETQSLKSIAEQCPAVKVELVDTYTLLSEQDLPFTDETLPPTYSPFRRKTERLPLAAPIDPPKSLPRAIELKSQALQRPDWIPNPVVTDCEFRGGEAEAINHLNSYFDSDIPLSYKEVRNALDGWDNSSKMSPWLNNGSLSVRRLRQCITDFENAHGANDSTYWLFVELLWREYFSWLAFKLGAKLFSFKGNAKASPLTSLYPERFQKWCYGNTPYPLVNACMQQLLQTGYLSNRGRQIAASCLVNELQVDWRHGAAWFEQQLVDYDVGSNWGNWQYIAGVGADPRGGRHFNLDKQTEMFDADGSYRARWVGTKEVAALDTRDAADWPLS